MCRWREEREEREEREWFWSDRAKFGKGWSVDIHWLAFSVLAGFMALFPGIWSFCECTLEVAHLDSMQ